MSHGGGQLGSSSISTSGSISRRGRLRGQYGQPRGDRHIDRVSGGHVQAPGLTGRVGAYASPASHRCAEVFDNDRRGVQE